MEPASPAQQDAPTRELLAPSVGDRCTNCQALLAPDQRYCVNCGERRGRARFSFETLMAKPPPSPTPGRPRRRPTSSASLSFIAGVATLLLAVGVGVLIGHNTAAVKQTAAVPNQVIKVEGLGGSSAPAASAPVGSPKFTAPSIPKLKPKVIKKVNAAAATVLGSGTKNLSSNPTVQPGQKCSGGMGCQNGKFTGNFFGGG